ncbi:hypothetical protein NNJEOMEG_03344 [Fundidesulfovibrio magnetotacticus]|uniref:Uncharacterized protein n=1 Tax=Fundidesulfovibrio magnetotacticus TaxID=2730080 RepID=A0A6V8LZN3_9BACT|nr:hypothetical protein [Fundidesulfovibrio magnetotacticus]GFK95479.1 hypothetical protein NNJEOMEG_03344 [Fundidesulfovibrio magnetotacticus]
MPNSKTGDLLKIILFFSGFFLASFATIQFGSKPRIYDIGDFPVLHNKNVMLQNACWVAGADAYNNPDGIRASLDAMPVSILNYVLKHEADTDEAFTIVNMGRVRGFGVGQTLRQLEALFQHNSGKNILYFTGPGGLLITPPETIPEALCSLERLRDKSPGLARWIDPLVEPLRAKSRELGYPAACPGEGNALKRVKDILRVVTSTLFGRFLGHSESPGKGVIQTFLTNHATDFARRDWTGTLLDPPPPPSTYFTYPSDETFYLDWLKLFAALARENGSKLLVVVPPQVKLPKETITGEFKSEFIDKLQAAFKGFDNVSLIDLSAQTAPYSLADMVFFGSFNNMMRPADTFFVSGKLKQARQLVSILTEQGVVSGDTGTKPVEDMLGAPHAPAVTMRWAPQDNSQQFNTVYMENTPQFLNDKP